MDDLGSTYTTQGTKTLPELNLSGLFTAGSTLAGPASHSNFYTVRDLVTKSVGKHSLGLGAEVSMEKDLTIGDNYNNGIFNFSTSAPTTTGFVQSDFVTGQVYSMEQDTPYTADMSQWYYALYAQDYYRLTSRLTLSLGLRWDLQTSPVEAKDRTATFVPGVQSTKVPTAPLGMLFPGDAGVPRGLTNNRYHHISPRIGVAWDPFGDGKTAIRAGAGVFYGSVVQNEWAQPAGSQPFAVRQTFNSITSLSNVYGNAGSFPNGDPFPYTYNPSNTRFLPAAAIAGTDEKFQWPLVYQINAAVQHQLPGRVSLTTAYVATLSHDLPFMIDANYAPYAAGANTTQASINARRPYDPGVLGQVSFAKSIGTASFHSLQISASRPMTHNIQFSAFWVLSHSLQSADESLGSPSQAQDFNNLWEERGPTDYDRRQMVAASAIWNINYYQSSSRLVKQVLNGWAISMISQFQSGAPVNMVSGANNNFDSNNLNRPNLVGPSVSAFYSPHRDRNSAATAWFNTAAFVKNGPGVAGGIGPGGADGNTPRNYLRAPGFRTVNLGLHRDFSITHGLVFQLRGEATNALNLVSLSAPYATFSNPSTDGHIYSASTPRLIQLGARLAF